MDAFMEARVGVFERVAQVRERRDEVKARVVGGDLSLAGIAQLGAADRVIATMKALPLIESLPGVGKVQTRRALEATGIPEVIRVDAIEPDQWMALEALLYGARL